MTKILLAPDTHVKAQFAGPMAVAVHLGDVLALLKILVILLMFGYVVNSSTQNWEKFPKFDHSRFRLYPSEILTH